MGRNRKEKSKRYKENEKKKRKKKKGMNKRIKLCRPMMYPQATKGSNYLFHKHHRKNDYTMNR